MITDSRVEENKVIGNKKVTLWISVKLDTFYVTFLIKKKAILYGLMLKLVIDKKAQRVSGAFKFVPFLQRV